MKFTPKSDFKLHPKEFAKKYNFADKQDMDWVCKQKDMETVWKTCSNSVLLWIVTRNGFLSYEEYEAFSMVCIQTNPRYLARFKELTDGSHDLLNLRVDAYSSSVTFALLDSVESRVLVQWLRDNLVLEYK